jgi:hypothetical protein
VGKGRGGGGGVVALLRWPALALAVLTLASVFAPLARDYVRGLHWALCLFAVLEAGIAVGRGDRTAIAIWAAIAVLINPFQPFAFPPQVWRLVYAATGIWIAANHLPGRG